MKPSGFTIGSPLKTLGSPSWVVICFPPKNFGCFDGVWDSTRNDDWGVGSKKLFRNPAKFDHDDWDVFRDVVM